MPYVVVAAAGMGRGWGVQRRPIISLSPLPKAGTGQTPREAKGRGIHRQFSGLWRKLHLGDGKGGGSDVGADGELVNLYLFWYTNRLGLLFRTLSPITSPRGRKGGGRERGRPKQKKDQRMGPKKWPYFPFPLLRSLLRAEEESPPPKKRKEERWTEGTFTKGGGDK